MSGNNSNNNKNNNNNNGKSTRAAPGKINRIIIIYLSRTRVADGGGGDVRVRAVPVL